jgi:biopolymer transport protein ExbD
MKGARFPNNKKTEDINISPLIDMVFILLIFFIVTTVFVDEIGLEVTKPQPASAQESDKDPIIFTIQANGRILSNGRDVGISGVRPEIQRLSRGEQLPVVIQVQSGSRAGLAIQVMDEALQAGALAVNLAARN